MEVLTSGTDMEDCSPGGILREQMKKLGTLTWILAALFCAHMFMTLLSLWQGISIIVNVYLYVFSFYLIYIFSSLDARYLKGVYRVRYGRKGDLLLFIVIRALPFTVIYLVTAVFITIDYYGETFWPWRPIMELMDGRFSNIIFYSLILLVIVKLRREPRITIPLFLLLAVLYFLVYKLVYTFSPTGLSISLLKYFQLTVAIFFVLNEYISDRKRLPVVAGLSLATASVMFFSLVSVFFLISTVSRTNTYPHVKASLVLLKLGFTAPLGRLRNAADESGDPQILSSVLYYSERAGMDLDFSERRWESFMTAGESAVNDQIASYLGKRNRCLPCGTMADSALMEASRDGASLLKADNLLSYTAACCSGDFQSLAVRLPRGNAEYRIWVARVASKGRIVRSVPLLVDMLTGVNEKLAEEAYRALVLITGIDSSGQYRNNYRDLELAVKFNRYYREKSAALPDR